MTRGLREHLCPRELLLLYSHPRDVIGPRGVLPMPPAGVGSKQVGFLHHQAPCLLSRVGVALPQ